ncbi:hypothetical protein [Pseudomonas sp. UFMG81]|uniref:hypothetical protein n=1 Tax=Pseudomonas sp. UFMG81 TaxID=2745936 RepID=UPI00188FC842|nr:hypothetical protein [Pseudomonas sp. UFMG81]
MNELNLDRIYRLEKRLIADGQSVNELAAAFSIYLLSRLEIWALTSSSNSVDLVLASLSFSATFGTAQASNEAKRALRLQVAEIEISLRQVDPVISNVARCAGDCLYDESDWQENNDGDNTPLFYYLDHLERIKPDAAEDFFGFFCDYFNVANFSC